MEKKLNKLTASEKVAPHVEELEEVLIGTVLIDGKAIPRVIDFITKETFFKLENQLIWDAIAFLYRNSVPIDILTVTEILRKNNQLDQVGGAYYLTKTTERVSSSANIEKHARILQEKYLQRELIRIGNEIVDKAYDDYDAIELMEDVENKLFNASQQLIKGDYKDITRLVSSEIHAINFRMNNRSSLIGIASGYTDLDRVTNGWQSPDLIILAARPSMGKTALSLMFARNAAIDFQKSVGIFSIEMSAEKLVQRLISAETGISYSKIQTGDVSDNIAVLYRHSDILSKSKIYIDDTPGLSIFEIRSRARRMKMKNDINLIIIDYLQLMKGEREKNNNREQEISSISRGLKSIAKELGVPIIALSQLSRECEKRADKRPQLSDLRESGSIEQDADIVIFMYRGAYYGDKLTDGSDYPEECVELNVSKNRNGAITMDPIVMDFDSKIQKFTDKKEKESF